MIPEAPVTPAPVDPRIKRMQELQTELNHRKQIIHIINQEGGYETYCRRAIELESVIAGLGISLELVPPQTMEDKA